MKSTICLVEDREACEPSVKLLLASLNMHCPGATISLFYPPANDEFLDWIKKYPQVRLWTDPIAKASGWNIKPRALMKAMDQGFEEVIWLDSDIIVSRDIVGIFAPLRREVIVATEDALGDQRDDPNALRAHLWGFPVGRALPFALNSGVLRVTRDHYHLMERWWNLVQSSAYQDFQRRAWNERPVHMRSDQDVLTALLASKEYSSIPVHILRRGKDILQFNGVYGYTVADRMKGLLRERPAFIHSFGAKPWSERWRVERVADLRSYIKKIYLDLSPYTICALQFRDKLKCDTGWMEPHYALSRILRVLGVGCPELVGLPIAAFIDLGRIVKCMQKSTRLNRPLSETRPQTASER